jgi:hypothetical protein
MGDGSSMVDTTIAPLWLILFEGSTMVDTVRGL